ncbi:hypothetical protein [Wolbachia endosymbiont of Folsomia candida]|uniref:hypothetical protein n=1 Tax=Wolbachia endosymbiont of Folsomia candida TaxID=169402 RepID=UPI000AADECF1|nr:hypothetical protein [Wolbachia endosymbiont of Folsomia candida]APR98181.1 hypothetical protein ASM33_02610 [Wolbachia endosymbiont of Folsomia candida]
MKNKEIIIGISFFAGVAATIGAIESFGLSFIASSPLIMGGVVSAIAAIVVAGWLAYDVWLKGALNNEAILFLSSFCVTSTAIGVGLGVAVNTIFPGVMLGMWSPALVGAVIGAIAPIAGFCSSYLLISAAKKVLECSSSKTKNECDNNTVGEYRRYFTDSSDTDSSLSDSADEQPSSVFEQSHHSLNFRLIK